jgi:histidyl-tRNA synthetase
LGLERLALVLDEVKGKPAEEGPVAFLVAVGDAARRAQLVLARELRRAGVRCELSFSEGSFGKQFKSADRRGAKFAVVLGEHEMEQGLVTVKHLGTGEQREMARAEVARHLLGEGTSG